MLCSGWVFLDFWHLNWHSPKPWNVTFKQKFNCLQSATHKKVHLEWIILSESDFIQFGPWWGSGEHRNVQRPRAKLQWKPECLAPVPSTCWEGVISGLLRKDALWDYLKSFEGQRVSGPRMHSLSPSLPCAPAAQASFPLVSRSDAGVRWKRTAQASARMHFADRATCDCVCQALFLELVEKKFLELYWRC